MARSTGASPIHRANAKTSRPATTPTSIPRRSRVRVIKVFYLVAGKAEKMPAVVQKLMHHRPAKHRGSALLRADKVNRQQQQQPTENRIRQNLTHRNNRNRNRLCNRTKNGLSHRKTSRDHASHTLLIRTRKECLALNPTSGQS